MKIELSDYFKEKGFRSAYLFVNNMGRNCVELVHTQKKPNGRDKKRFITYAKYLWISENKKEVPFGFEVDHINGNPKDDRIENLQVISKYDNIIKEKRQNNKLDYLAVELICPVCGTKFSKRLALVLRGEIKQPRCCSLSCSGKLSWMNIPFDKDVYINDIKSRATKIKIDKLTKKY